MGDIKERYMKRVLESTCSQTTRETDVKVEAEVSTAKRMSDQETLRILEQQLIQNENIVQTQKKQILNLGDKVIKLKQTESKLQLTEQCLKAKNEEIVRLQHQLEMTTNKLLTERLVANKYKEKIEALTKSLDETSKIEKDLEKTLSNEAAKTKRVQEELELVIEDVNHDNEKLTHNFQKFVLNADAFLSAQKAYEIDVLNIFRE